MRSESDIFADVRCGCFDCIPSQTAIFTDSAHSKARIIDSHFHAKATVDLVHAINGLKPGHPHIVLGWRYLGSPSYSGHFLCGIFRRLLYVRPTVLYLVMAGIIIFFLCLFYSRSFYARLKMLLIHIIIPFEGALWNANQNLTQSTRSGSWTGVQLEWRLLRKWDLCSLRNGIHASNLNRFQPNDSLAERLE